MTLHPARYVAPVVMVQIQRLCQGGGVPAATQTPWNFWTPLDKNRGAARGRDVIVLQADLNEQT